MPSIRAKAICVFRNKGKILLAEGFEPEKSEEFWIPVGGGIEFGESAIEAVKREVIEEISAEITNVKLLGVLESKFSFDAVPYHEIVFAYQADFVDSTFYQCEQIEGIEANGKALVVKWIDEQSVRAADKPLYPEGLASLLWP